MLESARGSNYCKFGASAGGCPFERASPFGREEGRLHVYWVQHFVAVAQALPKKNEVLGLLKPRRSWAPVSQHNPCRWEGSSLPLKSMIMMFRRGMTEEEFEKADGPKQAWFFDITNICGLLAEVLFLCLSMDVDSQLRWSLTFKAGQGVGQLKLGCSRAIP
ncbi:unnamed protein product [Prunus armeniaca]